ncbi:helix-turn-helix domain-containing protein [Enterococcus faecium]|uniref:helix-turn-helix transcriptional regulator n=1 Tax=Enterococcus faecium TaxID=1352 RepID=UPI001920D3C0|nr:helix-turn-helix transcriptional regulator [Enterococcus faecium]MBL3708422.1 helix-turn-helix domain-containing protein [Enterococcus faecium]
MANKILITNNLRKARKEQGISQERLALRSGISKQTIALIEKGDRLPSLKTAYAISSALRVSIYDIFPFQNIWVSKVKN